MGMNVVVAALALAATVATGTAGAEPQTQRFYGYAYDLASGKYLYTEVYREQVDGGRWLSGDTRYYSPAGIELGEKTYSFAADPYIPVYRMSVPGAGYSEGVDQVGADRVLMFKSSTGKGRQTAVVRRIPVMAADCGFHSFIVAHFAELQAGQAVKFRFVVAGQLASYGFRAMRFGDTRFENRPAVQLKIEPDSLFRFLVAPLLLTYDPQSRRLLEYRGVSNLINPVTGKAYNARIAYYSRPPDDAPKNLPPLD